MKTKLFTFLGLTILAINSNSQIFDDFNDGTIDSSKWQALAPLPDSQMTETGGNAVFFQRGILITQQDVPTAYEITGRFAFLGGTYDQFQINLRSDATLLSPHFNFTNNIYVCFNRRASDSVGGEGVSNLNLAAGYSTQPAFGSFLFVTGQFYDFKITDDGYTIAVFLENMLNRVVSVNTTERTGNKIGIENRGYVPWFATYDNQVALDYISIVPESRTDAR